MKKIIFLIAFLSLTQINVGLCNNNASQNVICNLPLVLEIEKIIVKNIEFKKDGFMSNVKIEKIDKIDNEEYLLTLSPVIVKIITNASSPIIVYADFTSLAHSEKKVSFRKNNLSIYPESYTINNPKNHVVTDIFTPYAILDKDTEEGIYDGTLTFTLGAL